MAFYMPTLLAYYLTRNTPREAVRAEKARAFSQATLINISAEEPELVFLEQGRAAVMRFRKRYQIEGGSLPRRGEVVQELRWRQTDTGWKIYSERDIRTGGPPPSSKRTKDRKRTKDGSRTLRL